MNNFPNQKRRVLFHRSWTKYNGGTSGGQIKVRDAYDHILEDKQFEPAIYFGKETVWFDNPGNVWNDLKEKGLKHWEIKNEDVLFFAGYDWKVLTPEQRKNPPVPVINIAQPRQIRLNDARKDFLKHPAIRIAKSSIGKKILEDYGVNGPVYYIPDAIDMHLLPKINPNPDLDILIVGLKYPLMARALSIRLKLHNLITTQNLKIAIQVPPKLPTRQDFLNLLNRTKIAVFLPLDEKRGAEGFYLPALEGMTLKKLVICPYAVGNIDFCIPNETCILPEYNFNAIYKAILQALKMTSEQQQTIINKGFEISQNHTLKQERKSILQLLHQANDIWNKKTLFQF